MTTPVLRKTHLIVVVVVIIVLLGLLARASMSQKSLDAKFRREMANRFDLEKKVLSLEKEQAGLFARIKSLSGQIEADKKKIGDLQASLDLAAQENKGLKDALSQMRAARAAASSATASGAM